MSETIEFKVPLTTIKEVFPHSNADSLEFVKCYDFNVVVKKDVYKVGDKVIYCPIDSILPSELAAKLFPQGSKITLNKGRIKQIKIRNQYSQGMIIDPKDVGLENLNDLEVNLATTLNITKYEPPSAQYQGSNLSQKRDKPRENPLFHTYNGIENIKWYPDLFKDEEVVIQEKLHGSCCRAAILPYKANTLWKKLKKLLRLAPEFEHCYGSNNVQLQERRGYKGFYGEDVYGNVLKKVDAFNKMQPGETIYGELIGEGIQKNYSYGHKDHEFVLFDVKRIIQDGSQSWLSPEEVEKYAHDRGFKFVPVLYTGTFNKDLAYEMTKGPSVYHPATKVREGIILKSRYNYNDNTMPSKKKCLKWLSEEYLNKEQSEFH